MRRKFIDLFFSYFGILSLLVLAYFYSFLLDNKSNIDWASPLVYYYVSFYFHILPTLALVLLYLALSKLGIGRAFHNILLFIPFAFLSFGLASHVTANIYICILITTPLTALFVKFLNRHMDKLDSFYGAAGYLSLAYLLFVFYSVRDVRESEKMSFRDGSALSEAIDANQEHPPTLVMLFDGLALKALLDTEGNISKRFPAFRELAGESIWFKNGATNYDSTTRTIKSMMTGIYFEPEDKTALPFFPPFFEMNMPNLLNISSSIYRLELHGSFLRYCKSKPGFLCKDENSYYPAHPFRYSVLLFNWFLQKSKYTPRTLYPMLRKELGKTGFIRWKQKKILESIEERKLDARLIFYHGAMPHAPYIFRVDGSSRSFAWPVDFLYTPPENELLEIVFQRYLEQIEFTDRLLGKVMDSLKKNGNWEKMNFVVTSDHGVAWEVDHKFRGTGRITDQTALIPMFIKPAGLEKGEVREDYYQHINFLPTMLQMMNLKTPGNLHGYSVLKEKRELPYIALSANQWWTKISPKGDWKKVEDLSKFIPQAVKN